MTNFLCAAFGHKFQMRCDIVPGYCCNFCDRCGETDFASHLSQRFEPIFKELKFRVEMATKMLTDFESVEKNRLWVKANKSDKIIRAD